MERRTTPSDRDAHLDNLKEKLLDRNYPEELVDTQIGRAKQKDRKELIFKQRKHKTKSDNRVRLIFTQNKVNPPIHMWVRQCKQLLVRNDKAKAIGEQIQIGSRQPKTCRGCWGVTRGGQKLQTPLKMLTV